MSAMETGLMDNSTRKKIILSLKKNGDMSVDSLSKEVNITPMGIRQHLLILERNGIVEYFTKKHGVGRPGFLYRLTDLADELFPKAYEKFAVDLLVDVEEKDGREKISELFKRRYERTLSEKAALLAGKNNLSDRLSTLAESLQKDGYIVDLEENGKHYSLKQFNCIISKVAFKYKEACTYDLHLLKKLIGDNVIRQHCLSDGARACVYLIPKSFQTA